MFDYKKLDQYKVALDDGFILTYAKELLYKGIYLEIDLTKRLDGKYNITGLGHDTYHLNIAEKDWETFKKKVEEFFKGGENGEF